MLQRVRVEERTVASKDSGKRLRLFLSHQFRDILLTRNDIVFALRSKNVHINGEIKLDSYELSEGDRVEVRVDVVDLCRKRLDALGIELRYQDPEFLVLYKPPGINRLDIEWASSAYLTVQREGADQNLENTWCTVNEIEKGAQGLVLVANNAEIHKDMLNMISNGLIEFKFFALCHGKLTQEKLDNFSIDKLLSGSGKDENDTDVFDKYKENGDKPAKAREGLLFDKWLLYNCLPRDIFDHISVNILSTTRSSGAGYLTTIEASVKCAAHASLVLRRFMYELGHPIAGSQSYTRPLSNHRDKGVLISLSGITILESSNGSGPIYIRTEVPQKFVSVREREERFYKRRQERAQEEIQRLDQTKASVELKDTKLAASGVAYATKHDSQIADGVPAAYITGVKLFCNHTFKVSADTLIPRPSTETLVNVAVDHLTWMDNSTEQRVLDLGTGSGCVLISILLKIPGAFGVGVDISNPALEVAIDNMRIHRIEDRANMVHGSFESFSGDKSISDHGPYKIIVCNPPYISPQKAKRMTNTIGHEPSIALIAEDGGFMAYHQIHDSLNRNPSLLASRGFVCFEIGKGMERGVRSIFSDWVEKGAYNDYQGFQRVLVFQRPDNKNTFC